MEIKEYLQTKYLGHPCVCFEKTDSTNTQARRLAEAGAVDGTLILADQQLAGKGRHGRTWVSPAGANIYMSLLLRPKIKPENASMLTLVMGLSAAKVCGSQIKWPNDLVVQGRKLCGILTELGQMPDGSFYLILGVGINVRRQEFPQELQGMAIAFEEVVGHLADREQLAAQVLNVFEKDYEIFLQTQDLSGLKEAYEAYLVNLDQRVKVLDPSGSYEAYCRGIDQRGQLLVECDGQLRRVYAGEVSVRGIYGYV